MAPLVGCSKVVSGHRSVNLGCRQINVTQQLLDRAQVGASFEEVGCEGMSESVGEAGHALIENTSDAALIECTPANTDEERTPGSGLREFRPTFGQPPVDRPARRPSKRHDTLAVALAGDRDQVSGDVGNREPRHLGDTHTGGVQKFEQCPISQRRRVVSVDGLDGLYHCS